jgi:hypothetical protein
VLGQAVQVAAALETLVMTVAREAAEVVRWHECHFLPNH